MARTKRLRGFAVLHPVGWDSFGLPAENAAIKTGTHPETSTLANIEASLIEQALRQTEGNRTRAAELLGLSRTTLIDKLKRRE